MPSGRPGNLPGAWGHKQIHIYELQDEISQYAAHPFCGGRPTFERQLGKCLQTVRSQGAHPGGGSWDHPVYVQTMRARGRRSGATWQLQSA